jgi:hypothetical protein
LSHLSSGVVSVAQFNPWQAHVIVVDACASRTPGPNEDELEHTQIRLPITLECARKIGDIIKNVSPTEKPQVSYSFYM